jgi:hypothetical protein
VQIAELYDPPTESRELVCHFTLSDADLAANRRRRGEHNRLSQALMLYYLRYPGRPLRAGERPPDSLLAFVAEQLDVSRDDIDSYLGEERNRQRHSVECQERLGLGPYGKRAAAELTAALLAQAIEDDRFAHLAALVMRTCRERRIVVPPRAALERLCAELRHQARWDVHRRLTDGLSAEQRRRLDALTHRRDSGGQNQLTWLRQMPEAAKSAAMIGLIERLEHVRAIGIEPARDHAVRQARMAQLVREASRVTVQHIAGYERHRRHATLVAVSLDLATSLTDQAGDLFDRLVGAMFRKAEVLARPETFDAYQQLPEHYAGIRQWSPAFLAAFTFDGEPASASLLRAIAVLRQANRAGTSVLPDTAPTGFVRPRWAPYVLRDGKIDHRDYELCVLAELLERLQAGDVWVSGSRRYRSFDERLISAQTLQALQQAGTLLVAVETDFERFIAGRRALLDERLSAVEARTKEGSLPGVTITKGVLKITPVEKTTPPEAEALAERLYAMLPRIRVTDLLAEVAGWTRFPDCFTHQFTGEVAADSRVLMAGLLAEGLNLGLTRMAEASSIASLGQLAWTSDWHIRKSCGARPVRNSTRVSPATACRALSSFTSSVKSETAPMRTSSIASPASTCSSPPSSCGTHGIWSARSPPCERSRTCPIICSLTCLHSAGRTSI